MFDSSNFVPTVTKELGRRILKTVYKSLVGETIAMNLCCKWNKSKLYNLLLSEYSTYPNILKTNAASPLKKKDMAK